MKLMNFRRFDPVYQAQGKSGLVRGKRLARTAEAIKANLEV
jgi:hypothetical protein